MNDVTLAHTAQPAAGAPKASGAFFVDGQLSGDIYVVDAILGAAGAGGACTHP